MEPLKKGRTLRTREIIFDCGEWAKHIAWETGAREVERRRKGTKLPGLD